MADYRDLAAALGGGYGQDTGGITPDTLITLKGGKKATASDLLGMIKEIGAGSLSNLESLVRGGVAQIPGAGGDIEGLARMGINKAFGAGGVNVSPTPVLPTTTDILGMMPRGTATRPETTGMQELGGYMAPATAKLAGKVIKATEGMPVGMGIKDVGKSAITREGNPIQGAVVLVGDKIFMGKTHGDALNRAIYEGVVRKEGGKYIYPKGAEVNSDLFMTKDGQIIDRLQASRMFDVGASETAIEKGLMQNNPSKSMTVDSYMEQAKELKQQKAAPPVKKTGLPSPQSLTMPSVPTIEQMQKYARTEVVPLSKAVSFQSARNWDKFKAGKGPGDLVAGYGDKPLALRLETGEYVIYDGNHRTDLALQKGQTELPMHVIDVKSYDPAHAGRKPVPPSMSDDELLKSLLGNN